MSRHVNRKVAEERCSRNSLMEKFSEQNTTFVKDKGSHPPSLTVACSKEIVKYS